MKDRRYRSVTDYTCDCRVWRKALTPLMETCWSLFGQQRAAEPIDEVKMRRIPASLIGDLGEALYIADQMFPPGGAHD